MRKIQLLILLIFISQITFSQVVTTGNYQKHDSIKAYVEFLEKPHLSAKDYIIGLFDNYDFVVFVEREHPEMKQYELLMDIFADKRFQDQVGHIFHEIGGGMWDKEYNNYLHAPDLTQEQSVQRALEIQRKMSWYPVWPRGNYHDMLTGLYEINRKLPKDKKLSLHPTDISIDWDKMTTEAQVMEQIMMMQLGRDSVMSENIMKVINTEKGKRKKYFAILNSVHGTFQKTALFGQPYTPVLWYLEKSYPGKIANVLINMQNFRGYDLTKNEPFDNGKIDAAFEYLGLDNVGFDFAGSPFAKVKDQIANAGDTLTFGEKYTGFVFYGSIPNLTYQEGVKSLIDKGFAKELLRRNMIFVDYATHPEPEDAFEYYNQLYNYNKRTHNESLGSVWSEVTKWLLKPEPKTRNFFFEMHEDSLSLKSIVEPLTNIFRTRVRKAGFSLKPDFKSSMKTTPLLIYYDVNYNIHYPYWYDLDNNSKQFLLSITNNEAEAKKLFGLFFNTFYLPHEMAHYLSHISGDKAKLGSYEGEYFANQLAMLFWRDQGYFETQLRECYDMAKKVLPKLKNPVPAGENETEWFSKNYNKIVASHDPYTYGYFQFSQVIQIYEDEALKKQTLAGFLDEYKKEVDNLKGNRK